MHYVKRVVFSFFKKNIKHASQKVARLFLCHFPSRSQQDAQLWGWACPFSPLSPPSSVIFTYHLLIISGDIALQIRQKQPDYKLNLSKQKQKQRPDLTHLLIATRLSVDGHENLALARRAGHHVHQVQKMKEAMLIRILPRINSEESHLAKDQSASCQGSIRKSFIR